MTSKYAGNHLEVTICDLKILSLKDLGKKWFTYFGEIGVSVHDKIKVFLCNNTLNAPLPPLAEVPTKWFSYLPHNIPSPLLYKSANERVLIAFDDKIYKYAKNKQCSF